MYNKLMLSTVTVLRLFWGQGVAFHDFGAPHPKVISPALLFRAIEEPQGDRLAVIPGERALPANMVSSLLLTSVRIFLVARDHGESGRFHPN